MRRARPHCRVRIRPPSFREASVERRDFRSWLRASARAFVLFAARGRAARSRGWPNSPRPTASPRSRSPTPTTCSARSSSPTRWRRPASSRSSAARSRSTSATRTTAPRPAGARQRGARPAAHRAARRARGGLPQPDAAQLARLSGPCRQRAAARQARLARRRLRGADRAHRRTGRAARPGDRGRPAAARGRARRGADAPVRRPRSMSSCSATAPPRNARAERGADRVRLCAAACRSSPPTSRCSRPPRTTRRMTR